MKGQGLRTENMATVLVAVLLLLAFIPVPSFPQASVSVSSDIASASAGQEATGRTAKDVDPFYLAALDKGEKAFLAGDDRQATASLEVAVFGLGRRPDLLLRAQSRLAVCWRRLRNLDKSMAALQRAVKLIEASGAGTAALDKDIAAELKATADSLQVRLPGEDIKAERVRPVEAPVLAEPQERTEVPVKPAVEPGTGTKAVPAPVREPDPLPIAKAAPVPAPEKKKPAKKTSLRREPEDVRLPEPGEKAAVKTEIVTAPAPPEAAAVPPAGTQAKPAVKQDPAPIGQDAPAPIDDRKAPADKAAPVVTEMDVLESTLKIDPSNSGNAYRLCLLYLEQERFQEARRVLRNLMLRLPKETRAPIMLARAEYFLKNYTEALSLVHRMSDPFTRSKLDRDDDLRISIYSALCLKAMNQNRSSLSFYVVVSGSSSPDHLLRLLREDGLEKAWKALDSAFSDKPGPRG